MGIQPGSMMAKARGVQSRRAVRPALVLVMTLTLGACAETFLGPADFSGTYDPGPTAIPTFGGKSTYDGAVIFTNFARADVAAVLPADLELAENVSNRPDKHPVIVVISHHDNMRWLFPGPDPPYDTEYQEVILLIPFVTRKNGSKWHTLVERMYLDDALAIFSGNFYYGYQKQSGSFTRTDFELAPDTFTASHLGTLRFEADLAPAGHWRSADNAETTLKHFTKMQTIMAMPVIGRNPGSAPLLKFICSYFQWDFSATFVRPVTSRHRFVSAFTPATGAWPALNELGSVRNGAWALRGMEFRVGFPPFACQF